MFLSNKVVENQVKTYITYNKGRDWRLLQAPTADLQGNNFYCEQVSGPQTRDAFGYLGLCPKNVYTRSCHGRTCNTLRIEYLRNRKDVLNNLTVFNLLSGQIIRIIHLKHFQRNICNEL